MPRILGTGLVALDLIVSHSPDGRTLSTGGGGTCGNVLAILSHLGWDASWVGLSDVSPAAQHIRDEFDLLGVCTKFVDICDTATTPIFVHHVELGMQGRPPRHWFSCKCPNCEKTLPRYSRPGNKSQLPDALQESQVDVFFADRLSEQVLDMARNARRNGAIVFYEPSDSADSPWLMEMIEVASVVKYSHDRKGIFDSYRHRPFPTSKLWIETLGADGLRWGYKGPDRWSASLPAVENPYAVDPCGAGDWFTAGLLHALGRTRSASTHFDNAAIESALGIATHIAAWSCGFLGARGAIYADPETYPQSLRPSQAKRTATAPAGRPKPPSYLCADCKFDFFEEQKISAP